MLFLFALASGQDGYVHNIDIDNGLPSNFIYAMIKDRYGYLWMSTPEGVVRYNGYDTKVFSVFDGLTNNDIWGLMEDRSGKIWLSTISHELGYMQNGKYHCPYIPPISTVLYPHQQRPWGSGIVFTNANPKNKVKNELWLGVNDSLIELETPHYIDDGAERVDLSDSEKHIVFLINRTGQIFLVFGGNLYKVNISERKIKFERICALSYSGIREAIHQSQDMVLGDHIFSYFYNNINTSFYVLSVITGKTDTFDIRTMGVDEQINFVDVKSSREGETNVFLYTNKTALELETKPTIRYLKAYKLIDMLGSNFNDKIELNLLIVDSFWQKCVATKTNGLYVRYDIQNRFRKERDLDFKNFRYVGGESDHLAFWWNKFTSTLVKFDSTLKLQYIKSNIKNDIKKITRYNNDTFLVLGKSLVNGGLWLDKRNELSVNYGKRYWGNVYATAGYDKNNVILIAQHGLVQSKIEHDTIVNKVIDPDRYNGLEFDSLRGNYWAYNQDKVFIHNDKKGTDTVLALGQISVFGTKNIEQILIDKQFGNIFFRGSNKITLYDPERRSYESLFQEINLKKTSMLLYKNLIIVCGRFGVLFSKIEGSHKISRYVLYPNVKDLNYKYINDVQASWGKLLLNTDKGLFWVDIPTEDEIRQGAGSYTTQYKFILNYKDSTYSLSANDTLLLDQKNMRLQFDIINPAGNGTPKYLYHIFNGDQTWHELNSNEITLNSGIKPGHYYVLSIKAYDEVWMSEKTNIVIYVKPYWWQLLFQSNLFWLISSLVFMGLIVLLVYISSRVINKNQIKRNLRLGVELKSVYAQINPHFIFNTLGTVMFFIREEKMNEAYTHVAKFSKLLRAYIKSSRNRYITIAAETENLHNYVQLQQMRFEDKFDYEIVTDSNIDPQDVKIPALLLQPIVENAIDHGLFHRETKGYLKIEFKRVLLLNEINCIIDDNGIGRKASKLIEEGSVVKRESYGERLLDDLVKVFNKYEKIHLAIRYIDKVAPETGTTVIVSIKYPEKNER